MSDKEARQETKTQRTDGTWVDRIGVLTKSIALIIAILFLWLKTDEEQEKARLKQNPTYWWYVILERTGFDAVIRRFVP